MFAHIVVFLSFIYAIAIAHPLASVHELILDRARVRWSGLLACWMLAGVLLLVMNWLAIFRLAAVTDWSTVQVLAHILGAILIYYTCAFSAIRAQPGQWIDMPVYFGRNRVPILGSFLLFGLAAIVINWVDLRAGGPAAGGAVNRIYGILPNVAAEGVALIVRATWVQWIAVLFVLGRLTYLLAVRIAGG